MWESLSKFGLNYADLPTMVWNLSLLLRGATINIDKNNKERISVFIYLLNTVNFCCYIYAYQFSVYWFVFIRCMETKDMVAASSEFSLGMCTGPSLIKFLFMKIYANNMRSLTEKYLQCDALVIKGTRFSNNLLKMLRVVKKRAIIIWTIIIVNSFVYWILPIFRPGRHVFPQDEYVIYALEPVYETPNYEIAIAMNAFSVCFGGNNVAIVVVFLVIIIGYIEAHLLALSKELEFLWDDSNEFFMRIKNENENVTDKHKEIIINRYISKYLKDIIKFHTVNINLLQLVENSFRGIKVLEFICMTFGIVAELLGGLENTYVHMPYTLAQLFIDCLVGQKLINASNVFEDAIYSSKWENFNVSNQKLVLVMLQNSQKTLTVSAGGLTNLSFACFMAVTKSTFSAYTTLKSTMTQ